MSTFQYGKVRPRIYRNLKDSVDTESFADKEDFMQKQIIADYLSRLYYLQQNCLDLMFEVGSESLYTIINKTLFNGIETPSTIIKTLKGKRTEIKAELKFVKQFFKQNKDQLKFINDSDDREYRGVARRNVERFLSTVKTTVPEALDKIDEALNIANAFKRIKKHKPVSPMEIYDDTIVTCYDANGEEICTGELDYSPIKDYEHDDNIKEKIAKSKNVYVVYNKEDDFEIYGYWGVVKY